VDFEAPVHKPHSLLHGRNTEPRGTRQRLNRKSGTPVLERAGGSGLRLPRASPWPVWFWVLGYVAQAFLRHLVQTGSDFTAHGLVQAALGELNLNSLAAKVFNSFAAKVFAVCAESRGQPQVFEFAGVEYGIYWEHGSMNLEGAVESNQGAIVGDLSRPVGK